MRKFVFKGFSEDYVHYLPKQLKAASWPYDGSYPVAVSIPLRSVFLPINEEKNALEIELTSIVYTHPKGLWNIHKANTDEFMKALRSILVKWNTAKIATLDRH